MCAHASICAWTCENQSKNIYACLDLRKSLHKCLLKKYACFNLRFNLRKYFRKPLRTVGFALWFAQIHAHALICALICANLNGNSAGNRARILPRDFRFSIGKLLGQLPSKKAQWVREKRGNPQRTCSSRQQVQNYLWCLGCVGNQRFCEKFSVSLFFQQVTPLMNSEKWEKFVTTPGSRYNCQNTPARKRTLMLYHH